MKKAAKRHPITVAVLIACVVTSPITIFALVRAENSAIGSILVKSVVIVAVLATIILLCAAMRQEPEDKTDKE